ncbi:MAG: hypothetical protein ACYDBJ_21375, partial [Aggregatilineales bacterium]
HSTLAAPWSCRMVTSILTKVHPLDEGGDFYPGDFGEFTVGDDIQSVSSQQAAAAAPKVVSEEQLTVAELLREHIDRPETTRDEIREMRKFLKQPLPGAYVKRLRSSLQAFTTSKNILDLLSVVRELQQAFGTTETDVKPQHTIKAEDLYLVCYEYVC